MLFDHHGSCCFQTHHPSAACAPPAWPALQVAASGRFAWLQPPPAPPQGPSRPAAMQPLLDLLNAAGPPPPPPPAPIPNHAHPGAGASSLSAPPPGPVSGPGAETAAAVAAPLRSRRSPDLLQALYALHAAYEDLKLDVLCWPLLPLMGVALARVAAALDLPSYWEHYSRDLGAGFLLEKGVPVPKLGGVGGGYGAEEGSAGGGGSAEHHEAQQGDEEDGVLPPLDIHRCAGIGDPGGHV